MLDPKRTRVIVLISATVFAGLATTTLAGYYVYTHRNEIPLIKDFLETEEIDNEAKDSEESTSAPTWTIAIEDGNIVKNYQNGSETILVDKDTYDDVEYFSDVSVSPDHEYMCFLAHKLVPVWMDYATTDGNDVTEVGLAENCVWAHDSTMIAYTNHTTDVSPHDVYVYFLSAIDSTNFTQHLSSDTVTRIYENPVWADDDTTITSLFNSYDSAADWAQTTGFSTITIATGDVEDMSTNIDTSSWHTYTPNDLDISFKYPAGWTVTDSCDDPTDQCVIETSNDVYVWMLDFDPFVTGGGFGFLFDSIAQPSTTARTQLSIDGYSPYLVTN